MIRRLLAACLALTLVAAVTALPVLAQETAPSNAPTITPIKTGSGNAAAPADNGASNGADNKANDPQKQQDGGMNNMLLLGLLALLIIMWVFSSRGRKKQEAKRQEMLNAIKKGDTVTSIGGIIGTVVEVRDRDVIIKIDDSTRMKLARWAIRGVGDDSMTESEKKADDKK